MAGRVVVLTGVVRFVIVVMFVVMLVVLVVLISGTTMTVELTTTTCAESLTLFVMFSTVVTLLIVELVALI